MSTFFKVLSNLKHNGDEFKKDSVIEGEMEQLGHLVNDGVLLVVDGADSLEDAKELAKGDLSPVEAQEMPKNEPANTWEAKKEPVVADMPKEEEVLPEGQTEGNNEDLESKNEAGAPGVVGQGDLPPVTDEGDNL